MNMPVRKLKAKLITHSLLISMFSHATNGIFYVGINSDSILLETTAVVLK